MSIHGCVCNCVHSLAEICIFFLIRDAMEICASSENLVSERFVCRFIRGTQDVRLALHEQSASNRLLTRVRMTKERLK